MLSGYLESWTSAIITASERSVVDPVEAITRAGDACRAWHDARRKIDAHSRQKVHQAQELLVQCGRPGVKLIRQDRNGVDGGG